MVHSLITIGKPVNLGGWEGKASIADDFNAPIDDFSISENTSKEQTATLLSLFGSINDPTFVEPSEVTTPDAKRHWELMDE